MEKVLFFSKRTWVFILGGLLLLLAAFLAFNYFSFRVSANPVTGGVITGDVSKDTIVSGEESLYWRFSITKRAQVMVAVTSDSGKTIKRLYYAYNAPKTYTDKWDGKDGNGNILAQGNYRIYFMAKDFKGKTLGTAYQTIAVSNVSIGNQQLAGITSSPSSIDVSLNQTSRIECTIVQNGDYTLAIKNSSNEVMKTLVSNQATSQGTYAVTWNGTGSDGKFVENGTYNAVLTGISIAGATIPSVMTSIAVVGNNSSDPNPPVDDPNTDPVIDDPGTTVGSAQAVITVGDRQNVGYEINFDGSQSKGLNPFGQVEIFGINSYSWDFGDGTSIQQSEYYTTITHTYTTAGTYNVKLMVTDYAGGRNTVAKDVVVTTLPKVTVQGTNKAALEAAIEQGGRYSIVLLPAGTYDIYGTVGVYEGQIIQGAGMDRTKVMNHGSNGYLFSARGNNARITGMEIAGVDWPCAIHLNTYKNLFVDHNNIHHYKYVTNTGEYASGTFKDNYIHDNDYAGYGYGVQLGKGSYGMVINNQFEKNRHSIAAAGQSSPTYIQYNTGYDFINNTVKYNPTNIDVAVDMHPTGHGRIRIVGNTFDGISYAIGLKDGWGEIKNNNFKNMSATYVIKFGTPVHNGNTIPGAGVYHMALSNNTFTNCPRNWYYIEYGTGLTIDGKSIAAPYSGQAP